ncbi:MAG: UPF0175 family protein [Candidatus Undinarchaeales archaeon]|jgi:predicted HTH domain antitoxin|nr:UPF0175 family protein [Candidatus Undinarchaeales archaeon]MDP7494056.1 UPF0175 family protein [Candidatus Undinarchaeales archaeon]
MELVTFRSPLELVKLTKMLASLESRSLSDELREVFREGIAIRRKRLALDLYGRGDVSLGRAREIAGLSIWEFLDALDASRQEFDLDADDILAAASRTSGA